MAAIMFQQIIQMFIIIAAGVVAYKAKLITTSGNKTLSNLLLYIVSPLVILLSFQQSYDGDKLMNLLLLMLMSAATYVIFIPIVNLLVSKKNKEYAIERFSCIYSNAGFFGIPVVNSIFGLEGVFYLASYLVMFNVFVWTHGMLLMKGSGEKLSFGTALKSIMNPAIIAAVAGFFLFVLRLEIPVQIHDGLESIAGMNTPLAMIIAGVSLAQADLKAVLIERRIYYVAFIRLIFCPVLTMVIVRLFPIPEMLAAILVILNGCPVGATGTMFALKWNKNEVYASSIYVITTLLSLATLPLLMLVY